MRILCVSNAAHSPHVIRALRHLLEKGHDVMVMGKVNPFPEGCAGFVHIAEDNGPDHIMVTLAEIKRVFAPEVAHVHYADFAVYQVARSGIAPVVLSVWGDDINDFISAPGVSSLRRKSQRLLRWDLQYALPRCARIIVDDPAMPEKCRFLAPNCAPIECLPLGVDTQQFRPASPKEKKAARIRFGIADDHIALLSPRAFYPSYQHEAILDSFARIGKNCPNAHLYFKLYGLQDGSEGQQLAETLREKARCSPVAERVHFLPALPEEELHQVYWAMDGIINMPRNDAFPVTFAEAAATRTPIITRLLPAYKNTFIEHTSTLMEPFSEATLDKALRSFFANPVHDDHRLDAALDAAQKDYSFARYYSRLEEIYADVAQRQPSTPPALRDMPDGPLISVLTSAYNATEFLPAMLRSLQRQVYPNWEVTVVDDASNEGDVAAIVASFNDRRIKTVRHDHNKGACAGRNTAFAHSSGDYIMCQDTDDVLHPWLLQMLAVTLREQPDADIVMYDLACFGDENTCWRYALKTAKDMTLAQWIPGQAMVRRSLYERVGGFDESPQLKAGNHDWDFWLAAFQEPVTVAHIPLPLLYYRRHGNAISAKRMRFDFALHSYLFDKHQAIFARYGTGKTFLATGAWNTFRAYLHDKAYAESLKLLAETIRRGMLMPFVRHAAAAVKAHIRRNVFLAVKAALGPARLYIRSLQQYAQHGI